MGYLAWKYKSNSNYEGSQRWRVLLPRLSPKRSLGANLGTRAMLLGVSQEK